MTDRKAQKSIGQYVASGDWSDYWTTRISRAQKGRISVRGYPVEEIIEKLSYAEAAFLLLKGELPDAREAALFDLVMRSGMDQQFVSSAVGAARFTASAFPDFPVPALGAACSQAGRSPARRKNPPKC